MNRLFSSDPISFIYLIGVIQSLLFALSLTTRKEKTVSCRILIAWLGVTSLNLMALFLQEKRVLPEFSYATTVTDSFPFLYGPLFYLYTRALIRKTRQFTRVQLLHALPFVMHVFYLSVSSVLLKGAEYEQEVQRLRLYVPWLVTLHGFTYIALALRLLKHHSQGIRDYFSNLDQVQLNWLRILAGLQIFTWGIVLFVVLSPLIGINLNVPPTRLIYFSVTIQVYIFGYFGLKQPEIFAAQKAAPVDDSGLETTPASPSSAKYQKSGLNSVEAQQHLNRLLELMREERPFIDSDLTLTDLAERLSISSHHLSEIINTQLGQNFYDFVNSYRVKEVQIKLASPEAQHLTLLAIAFDAGFNSKSSFNAIFKKHTQTTPSEYKASLMS